ncbi:hypothetical protein [Paraburkholderia sp. XV]|uniref:hypothetical protein n=1 Tax=Paraburkholderia sp. XV TaxID=2831520 RepID=UPI001CD5A46B|nr:hypothetical protein [Paraburkholderia sp. XV]
MRGELGHDTRCVRRTVCAVQHEVVIVLAFPALLLTLLLLLLFVLLLPSAARTAIAAVARHAQCRASLTVGGSRVLSRSRVAARAARCWPACRSKPRRGSLALALLQKRFRKTPCIGRARLPLQMRVMRMREAHVVAQRRGKARARLLPGRFGHAPLRLRGFLRGGSA